jgi:hypothetical protein
LSSENIGLKQTMVRRGITRDGNILLQYGGEEEEALDSKRRSLNCSACLQAEAPQSSPVITTALPLPQVMPPQS